MLKLNIIPQELKNEKKQREIIHFLHNFFSVLVFFLILYCASFLFGKYALKDYFAEIAEDKTLITKDAENYTLKVKEINSQIKFIDEIQSQEILWSDLLEYLSHNIKSDIKITQISVNASTNAFFLAGNAKTRESLLQLEELLKISGFLDNVDLPTEYLLEKENIDFKIDAVFNAYVFKNK